ncbi:MAG: diadenylate cyclase CdaA [Clostridia bacterium]|nr:diadenylate cyclase CdaA [Clostridia bacterium]
MQGISNFFRDLGNLFSGFGFVDVIDIVVVALVLYYLIIFIYDRRAGKLAVGVGLLFLSLAISTAFEFKVLAYMLKNIVQVGIIALFILFQPELRTMLEKMGNESVRNFKLRDNSEDTETIKMIETLATAAEELSASGTGALIVIERGTKLGDTIKTGIVIDADVNLYLIKNIFFNKAPLHDGAMIIRGNRIHACGCFLPLSYNTDIIRNVGTRHRAAIGMSENSDALVVAVSEENGIISIAQGGKLTRNFDKAGLIKELSANLLEPQRTKKRLIPKRPRKETKDE